MGQGAAKQVDQKLLELYLSEYYERTDLVYRLGVVLTTSRDGAERFTEETFRLLTANFEKLRGVSNPSEYLFELGWRAWGTLKSERFHEWSHPFVAAIRPLQIGERVAMFAVDMLGLEPAVVARVTGQAETDLRKHLASGRRRLTNGEIKL